MGRGGPKGRTPECVLPEAGPWELRACKRSAGISWFDVLSNDLSESCSMDFRCLSVKFGICAGCFERSLKFINWEIFNYYRRDVNVAV